MINDTSGDTISYISFHLADVKRYQVLLVPIHRLIISIFSLITKVAKKESIYKIHKKRRESPFVSVKGIWVF